MALAANGTAVNADNIQAAAQAVNAAAIFNQAYLCAGSPGHGTAATKGRVKPFTSENGAIPLGFSTSRVTGDTSATPIPEATMDLGGRVQRNIAVTGLAGTVADNFQKVFVTDDNTFTLTRSALGICVGVITRFRTSALADVYFFDFGALCVLALSGQGKQTWLLGVVTAGATTGNMLTGIVAPHHGLITAVYGEVIVDATDADVTQTINLEIGGTDVTGGVITWLFSDAVGAKKAGTAITALNRMHEGDLIDVETVATVAGTVADPGLMAIYATVETDLGL